MRLAQLLAVARGEVPADLLLRNARLVNVFSGEIERADIAIFAGAIAGIGSGYAAATTANLGGALVAPGLIDAHIHIESSMCVPSQFAAAVLPRGVTTVITDPHEIANVAGVAGIRFMADSSRGLPLSVFIMAPSCVPATSMETNGATLDAATLGALLEDGTVHGLAEVMNFPGVVYGDEDILEKVERFADRPRDGHAPALSKQALNAYVAAGISSEHECTTVVEAAEKLARGMYVLIREATNAQNLRSLLPLVTAANNRRICFCTDDRVPGDLLGQGSIDYMVRAAIEFGIDPITALRMATLNSAECYGLRDRGAIAPGRRADLVIFDDFQDFRPRQVYAGGQLVAAEGSVLADVPLSLPEVPSTLLNSVHVDWERVNLRIPARGTRVRAIGLLADQVVTEERIVAPDIKDGAMVAAPQRDLLKIAVIDRHKASGSVGLGFIQGMGLERGAIAGTFAHDHHNLIVIGADDDSMYRAARAAGQMQGGLVVVDQGEVAASLPLPVAGLMSVDPVLKVAQQHGEVQAAARALGSPLHDAFMAMSFMALEVIPKLKLTDCGLVDVDKFAFVDLFVE